jgi:hypothetical protein
MGARLLRPTITAAASGSNVTINLADFIMYPGEDYAVAAQASRPLTAQALTSESRDIWIRVDNRAGAADAWLAHGSEVPALQSPPGAEETAALNSLVVPAGEVQEFGPWDELAWATHGLILRLIDGASVKVNVVREGRGA